MPTEFYRDVEKNVRLMEEMLHLDVNNDVVARRFHAVGLSCALYYVEGMSSGESMGEHLLWPLQSSPLNLSGRNAAREVMKHVLTAPEVKTEANPRKAVQELLFGQTLILFDGCTEAVVADLRSYSRRSVSTPQTETLVVGPHDAFNETLRDNLTLLHRRMATPDFVCSIKSLGDKAATQLAICYVDGLCPRETIEEIQRRLNKINLDQVLTSGILEQLIEDDPYAPLPQMAATERPDRAVSFLMEGQAVLLLDGSPRALALPMGIWHLYHSPDDSYMRWQYGTVMRVLRLIGALLALYLPAVFVSLVIYHPMTIPMTLLTSIVQSRSAIPLSLLGEALLMLLIFDLINESAQRTPSLMGSSLGLVSTLILGSAAVEAGLVSPLLIIVVALTGLGSYALPNYSLSFALRIGQILLLLAAGLMGWTGLCYMSLLLLCWVASMTSLGYPYLAPTSPRRTHNPDIVSRQPVFRQRLRTYVSNPAEMRRTVGPMRWMRKGGGK
ncbi:MAG: spore germination protein [Clostridia bacterium]|nr:spore germination protein [Clostridia bacterium]